MNRYTVILKSGKVLSFVVRELAETYVQAYGGLLIEDQLYATTYGGPTGGKMTHVTIPVFNLAEFEWNKASKRLVNPCASSFPRQFFIKSPSGKEVRFVVVGPEDVAYDQDQWDGCQQVYRPTTHLDTVEFAVLLRL